MFTNIILIIDKWKEKKWSKNALRYTRGVGISKIKPLWLLILVSFLIKITSRTLSGLCMGSRPTGRTVQERLFKRIRISSDCEEALQTSCISHSQTHSCPQITSVRLVSDIIWILFHNFFSVSYSRDVPASVGKDPVYFLKNQHGITVLVRSKYSSLFHINILFHILIFFFKFDLIICCCFFSIVRSCRIICKAFLFLLFNTRVMCK